VEVQLNFANLVKQRDQRPNITFARYEELLKKETKLNKVLILEKQVKDLETQLNISQKQRDTAQQDLTVLITKLNEAHQERDSRPNIKKEV
jgi:hypothetical protein